MSKDVKEDIGKEINELIRQIEYHNDLYYQKHKTQISDQEVVETVGRA
jgi:NAD-dependent DNA ligase